MHFPPRCYSQAWHAVLGMLFAAWHAHGQISYTGGLLRQDFNSLPTSGAFDFMDVGLSNVKGPAQLASVPVSAAGSVGWSIHARVGSPLQLKVDNGGSTAAGACSYGPLATSDRALGSLGGAHVANLGWRLVNNTGQNLTQFTLAYLGEQWRNGGSLNANKLDFAYRITPTLTTDIDSTSSYTAFTSLDFTSPISTDGSFALYGNASANRVERSATITGINWPDGHMLILRWRDTDETGSDDGLAIDDVMFFAPTTAAVPTVVSMTPDDGSARVLTTASVVVSFNQPVTVSGTAFELTGSVSGIIATSVTNAGPMRYTITPVVPFLNGETITVRVIASQVSSATAQVMIADATAAFATVSSPATLTRIHDVQGAEGYSPLTTAAVTVQGVVVADFQGAAPALGGFFLQEEDADADAYPATSEALWIADQGNAFATDVSVGDVLQITGTVSESGGLTQLVNLTAVTKLGTDLLPALITVTLPVPSSIFLERYEGMRVQFTQTLSVTSNSGTSAITDSFARFGELILSSGGPLNAPTEFIDPNDSPASGTAFTGRSNVPAIRAEETAQSMRSIVLDDASLADTPDPTPYLNAQGTRRCGDTLTGLTGILSYGNGVYRVQPVGPVSFADANPRPASPPAITGRLRVSAMNVLNYFTTFGGANDRGASNADEFQRQKDKIISALVALNADVLGLIEIQNNAAAVNDITAALNAAIGPDGYVAAPNSVTTVSGDFIRCVFLYRPSKVSLFGPCYSDTDAVWSTLRNPLAQVFTEIITGERFLACINHWKSKSSIGATGANVDQNDGQASFNDHRRQQAARLVAWLQTIRTMVGDDDVLIVGDLNSLGEEDPLDVLRANGFADQGARFQPDDYSYRLGDTRGRLDHAFATATMSVQITDAAHWHINADEPAFYDYNTEGKTAAQQAINVGTPFRSSDHDPVLIGISLSPQPTTFAMWSAAQIWPGGAGNQATDDPDGDSVTNLEEFILNSNPLVSDVTLAPGAALTGGDFQLLYRLRTNSSGVIVQPEWSENLLHWFPMIMGTPTALDSITNLQPATVPVSGRTRLFGRLRIDAVP